MSVPEVLRMLKNTGEYGTIMMSIKSLGMALKLTIKDILLTYKFQSDIKNFINTLYLYEPNQNIRTELYKILNTP